MCDEIASPDELKTTLKKKLDAIIMDGRSHREIAVDPEYSLRYTMPSLFESAATTVALHEGIS